ncbi:hypothetical protein BV898_02083 [Hypsibius exemplaris]|uniref:Tc1-like transposase DDE domain-containing protein n=1 Tax=Hypsibius exemplaris TaxID=2072580 RepID=A0A1W0X9Z3_HYPEX|nr:hypothetical protein BV898_02083 [Hypsibius exemplaris]
MPAPIDSEARGAILAHHQNGQSHRKIFDALFDLGFSVSKSTVTRVITELEREKRGIFKPAKKLGSQCLWYKRTKDLIKKVDAATNVDNPPTLNQMAERSVVPRCDEHLLRPTDQQSQFSVLPQQYCEANSGKNVPRLYPGEEHKVILHFDSASSHTKPAVYSYFKSKKVKYIGKEDWMANSPDHSPMDFGPNGIFKKLMFKKKPKGIPGLQRAARQVWKEFPLNVCRNVMKSWRGRVIQMLDVKGF